LPEGTLDRLVNSEFGEGAIRLLGGSELPPLNGIDRRRKLAKTPLFSLLEVPLGSIGGGGESVLGLERAETSGDVAG